MKKYRLKKDLPDAKAGTEFILLKHADIWAIYYVENQIAPKPYPASYLNNTEWFEEIKEQPAAKWTDEDMRKFAHFFSFQNYDRVPKMHELEHWLKKWKGGLYKPVGEPEPCVFINCTIDRESFHNRMQAINKECETKAKIQKIIEELQKIG